MGGRDELGSSVEVGGCGDGGRGRAYGLKC